MTEFMEDVVRERLCDHEQSTNGCVACRYVDFGQECREALSEHKKREETVESAKTRFADQALTNAQRKAVEEALGNATVQAESWARRLEQLHTLINPFAEAVDEIKQNKPELWANKFQELAELNAAELDGIFRTAYPHKETGRFSDDHSLDIPFTGLDRSKIPATSDMLIKEGKGLEVFLMAARHLGPDGTPRLPTTTVGEHFGPAFMSHGRAISMFGLPEDSGNGPLLKDDENNASSDEMQLCSLVSPDADEETGACLINPRTEREYRDQDLANLPIVSTLSEKAQWKKLGAQKYMTWVALLANQYNRLANTEASEPKATSTEDTKEGSPEQSAAVGKLTTVAKPDFAGFTNWVNELESAWPGSDLGKRVLPKWKSDNEKRSETLADKLRAAYAKPPITDASLEFRRPDQFNSQLPFLHEDIKALHLNPK